MQAEGTWIETENGPVAVELLAVGDYLLIDDGRYEPIVWIGRRAMKCERHPHPDTVCPVRVAAGAFGDNVPLRDLYLSPDHAVFVNDVLVPIGLLVNGAGIARVKRNEIKYFHVELPRHAIVFAEGMPVESYLDTGDRANFTHAGDVIRLFPDFSAALTPAAEWVWETTGVAPLVTTGAELEAVRHLIAEHAAALGLAVK
jgi:hypothetical protein